MHLDPLYTPLHAPQRKGLIPTSRRPGDMLSARDALLLAWRLRRFRLPVIRERDYVRLCVHHAQLVTRLRGAWEWDMAQRGMLPGCEFL